MVLTEHETFAKGLEGIIAAESSICFIDGKNSKLSFRGYDIHELCAKSNFEETAYLLLFGKLPSAAELEGFKKELAQEREVSSDALKALQIIPKDVHPMAALRTAISILGLYDKEADNLVKEVNVRKAIRLIAKTPTIVASLIRMREGQDLVAPKKDASVSTASNFLYMLKKSEPTAVEVKMLDQYLVLLAEHDLNASTFAARVTVATLSDSYSGVVSAIGTLKGDLHGSANSRAMEMILSVGSVDNVEKYLEDALNNKKKLMGFGHRVYKGPDPRADDLRRMARTLAEHNKEQSKWFAISEKLEKLVWDKKKLNCNVDFYSASVLYTIGIPVDFFTAIFAISRMAGWTAHIVEQLADNRLIRPLSNYTGAANQSYVSIEKR